MKASAVSLLAALALAACDQGSPSSSSDLGIVVPGSGASTGSGSGTGGSTGGTGSDTLLDSTSLDGPVTIEAGSQRRIVFYYPSDRQLHILASSDGGTAGTYDRETVWEVTVKAADTLYGVSISESMIESGFADSTHLTYATKTAWLRFFTVVRATEGIVLGVPGDTLTVSVVAHSQIIANPATAGIFPALLPSSATDTLIYAGSGSKPLGKVKFRIVLPSY
jgi:hypothetical protein